MGGWTTFWKTDLKDAPAVLHNSLLSHVITAKHAAPLMIRRKRGLIVEVSDGDLLLSGGQIVAQLVKYSVKGLAVMMAEELRKHRVTSVLVTPGYLRSETMLEHYGVTEANWRDGARKDPNFINSETPLFVGRAVAALAADPRVFDLTGELLSSWELARRYGFTDADGTRPDTGEMLKGVDWLHKYMSRHAAWLERLARRAKQYAGEMEAEQ